MNLSLITINKNNAVGLENTVKSVITQIYTDFEYIIIDGSSSDDSLKIIKKYEDKITRWVSEPDSGIYNAVNKAIQAAKGKFCLFLNSGDYLIDSNTLKNVFEEIKNCPESGIFYSDCVNQNNTITIVPKLLDIGFFLYTNINHQNSIIKRELFFTHGFYDEKFKIVSDWAFNLSEFWIHKTKFTYIKTRIALYDTHGISSIQVEESRAEREIVITNVFKELSPVLLEYAKYKWHLPNMVYSNIRQRQGLGFRFILGCIKHWFLRKKKA
jgi:glycosyltransferase involved in cell wall biosynthesis